MEQGFDINNKKCTDEINCYAKYEGSWYSAQLKVSSLKNMVELFIMKKNLNFGKFSDLTIQATNILNYFPTLVKTIDEDMTLNKTTQEIENINQFHNDVKIDMDERFPAPFSCFSQDYYGSNVQSNYEIRSCHSNFSNIPYENVIDNLKDLSLAQSRVLIDNSHFLSKKKQREEVDSKDACSNSAAFNTNLLKNDKRKNENKKENTKCNLSKENKKIISQMFCYPNKLQKMKYYEYKCINCDQLVTVSKFTNYDCSSYLCKKCIFSYFYILQQFGFKKQLAEAQCLACDQNFYFCYYCYKIEREKSRLIKCSCNGCARYFHQDCQKSLFILQDNEEEIKNNLPAICEKVYLQVTQKCKKNISLLKKNENTVELLRTRPDKEDLIGTLYKINCKKFYIVFFETLVKYIKEDNFSKIRKSSFQFNYGLNLCIYHLCFSCLKKINEDKDEITNICCFRFHSSCQVETNKHLKYVLDISLGHVPLLHHSIFKEIYSSIKRINMQFKAQNLQRGEMVNISPINKRKNTPQPSEKEETYKEITSNLFTYKNQKNDHLSKVTKVDKCECLFYSIKEYIKETEDSACKGKLVKSYLYTYYKEHPIFIGRMKIRGGTCRETCPNKSSQIECTEFTCESPHKICFNRYGKSKYYDQLELIRTEKKGWGVVSRIDIRKDDYILEYLGKVIDRSLMIESNMDKSKKHCYIMMIEEDLYIDASKEGNKAR
jgi:hypothetical protein